MIGAHSSVTKQKHHMKRLLIVLSFLPTAGTPVSAQSSEPVPANGFYVIQPKVTFKKGDAVFCNPATMPDRIILDSSKKMIAKRTGFPMGYTYYEWRRKDGFKTYEEISIPTAGYIASVYFTDSGDIRPASKNSVNGAAIDYYKTMPNPRFRYNGFNIARQVYVPVGVQSTDSLVRRFNIPTAKITSQTIWYAFVSFYENGNIQSTGTVVTNLKVPETVAKPGSPGIINSTARNRFKIGEWIYYDERGYELNKEVITTLRLMR